MCVTLHISSVQLAPTEWVRSTDSLISIPLTLPWLLWLCSLQVIVATIAFGKCSPTLQPAPRDACVCVLRTFLVLSWACSAVSNAAAHNNLRRRVLTVLYGGCCIAQAWASTSLMCVLWCTTACPRAWRGEPCTHTAPLCAAALEVLVVRFTHMRPSNMSNWG